MASIKAATVYKLYFCSMHFTRLGDRFVQVASRNGRFDSTVAVWWSKPTDSLFGWKHWAGGHFVQVAGRNGRFDSTVAVWWSKPTDSWFGLSKAGHIWQVYVLAKWPQHQVWFYILFGTVNRWPHQTVAGHIQQVAVMAGLTVYH